jgi:hypothetical protein
MMLFKWPGAWERRNVNSRRLSVKASSLDLCRLRFDGLTAPWSKFSRDELNFQPSQAKPGLRKLCKRKPRAHKVEIEIYFDPDPIQLKKETVTDDDDDDDNTHQRY